MRFGSYCNLLYTRVNVDNMVDDGCAEAPQCAEAPGDLEKLFIDVTSVLRQVLDEGIYVVSHYPKGFVLGRYDLSSVEIGLAIDDRVNIDSVCDLLLQLILDRANLFR